MKGVRGCNIGVIFKEYLIMILIQKHPIHLDRIYTFMYS